MKNSAFVLSLLLILLPAMGFAAGDPLHLDAPRDYQVFQRAEGGAGKVQLAGMLPAPLAAPATVEARLDGADWQVAAELGVGEAAFSTWLEAPAGGWFRLEVRVQQAGKPALEAQVDHVGVGEVFVIAGQSNSANHGAEKQLVDSGKVSTFDGKAWRIADDPQPGASGGGGSFVPPFGDAMAERFQVPIGIVATGVGATSVREWLPKGAQFPNPPTILNKVTLLPDGAWESKGGTFANFVARARSLGPHGFRAVLWHQGESDANQRDATRTLPGGLYTKYLEQLIHDSRREVGWDFPWFVAQASYHTPDDPGSPDIRAAQKALWDSAVGLEGPDTDSLAGQLRDNAGQGVHFSAAGLRAHGASWADKVAPWLEKQLQPTPVKVFILAGQSNMEGQGVVAMDHEQYYNGGKGNLVWSMQHSASKDKMQHLRGADGKWAVRDDVEISFKAKGEVRRGGLTVGYTGYGGSSHIGPELQFGHVVGDHFDAPVLLIKTAWGGKSLQKDFRPPSSGGETGAYYKQMLEEIRAALAATAPRPSEIAGFVWMQGWNDMVSKEATAEYDTNLVNFAKDVRAELKLPDLPFVIGELGNGGAAPEGSGMRAFREAQQRGAAQIQHAVFVPTQEFARPSELSPNTGHGHHWFGNAESYFLVGDALGHAMLDLLLAPSPSPSPSPTSSGTPAAVLDHRALLEAQTFWDNRDFDWFEANIPFLDTPDAEINTTYYYRWELVTKHLTYGSPDTGYLWTEFINRPFWSGAYGGISCPSGHQFYEARWLHDPRYSRDFARYWLRTPGAQPRRYSAWLADSVWATHLVHPDRAFIADLLPDLEENFAAWRARHWVEDAGMFWQVGHDDGMEFNIASRQTKNILAGAPSYRPSFNSYMWADARALGGMAALLGDAGKAQAYRAQAAALKQQVQKMLWDPKREFFLPMFRDDEEDNDGNAVKKNTRIYESGKFAGSPHGREEAGYVPWSFGLPDPGFEAAWQFLMDPEYFYAPFGPTTTERHDPLFLLQNSCCWWSGQSWPFATTQTLKGMAHLLQDYQQDHVGRADYLKLLHNYAVSQRKDGKPYIAEALHPDTGSWDGHDMYFRSEHYFHSGFVDLVITGLAGLKVEDSDTLTVDPLAPPEWEYFAIDQIPYRGHRVAIMWDKTGKRYGRGSGLQVLVDGKVAARSPTLTQLAAPLPPLREGPSEPRDRVNHAVNNDGNYFPRFTASHTGPDSSLAFVHDGNTAWYHRRPPLRWTCEGSPGDSDWVAVDFGDARRVDEVKLFLLDDGDGAPIAAPARVELQSLAGGKWEPVAGQSPGAANPLGHRPYVIRFPEIRVQQLRVVLTHAHGKRSGITEFEAWGAGELPYRVARPPAGILSFNADPKAGFPKASASFHDRYGGVPESAIDGKIVYRATPTNRWTSYGSPNATSDWLEVDFGAPKQFARVVLHIYDDHGGVQAPKQYTVEKWDGAAWQEIPGQRKDPAQPRGGAENTVTFPPVAASKLRVVFTHIGKGDTRSGVTEMEVWER